MKQNLVILLAEDSPDDVFFFRRALAKTQRDVVLHVVENGRAATEYLSNTGAFADPEGYPMPDIVFLDLKMPEMNGLELLQWLGQRFTELPFRAIVLTSSDEPKDYQQALDLGAHGYVIKPISVSQLAGYIQRQDAPASPNIAE